MVFLALTTIWARYLRPDYDLKKIEAWEPHGILGLTLQSVHDFSPQKWTIGQLGQQGQLEAYFTNQLT